MRRSEATDNKDNAPQKGYARYIFPAIIAVVWAVLFGYTFNEKLDLNGDNCNYYIYATSMATGHGYADISSPVISPTNAFPPGYPLLMTPLRLLTDSIVAQKILNGLFLLAGVLLLYFAMMRAGLRRDVSFVAAVATLFCSRVLHFATMMMSEMSFFCSSALVLYALVAMEKSARPFYRDKWFYVMVAALALNYHIRTQGIALAVGVLLYFVFTLRWKELIATAGGFAVCCLPWMLRNRALGFTNRYADSIMQVNTWRPEEGTLDAGGVVERFFDTLQMLLFKAFPNSVTPFFSVDYQAATPWYLYVAGVVMVAVTAFGFWQMGRVRWMLLGYMAATLGVISLFASPSENRYLTGVLPILTIGLYAGLWRALDWLLHRLNIIKNVAPPYLLLILLVTSFSGIKMEHDLSNMPYHPAYANFFSIGEQLKAHVPPTTVVCSRKPTMLYMYGKTANVIYKFTKDDGELISDLVEKRVDYVVLEQLGYSSTYLYLYPAIQKNPELFRQAMHCTNPDTYLLKFDREAAAKKFGLR